jgi:hypothetical protein
MIHIRKQYFYEQPSSSHLVRPIGINQLSLFMNESLIEEELTKKIIGAAIEVHRYWGPGLVESIYE